ncbi:hypothetical protein SLEP1_g28753 [Rubroshorea leprosula]|uniref:CCHC-type domain-containing protein n=1 Tax=Rubroshorea leprosula TaxID=152421 RepID=A0AAV5JXA2_9ROSI|nr:hypothetical protein SLEP1_g28753 [Rubroshorea leprosula]
MKVVGESEVPKEEVEWNDEDLVKIMINNKAINMLQCALNPTEFHRVFGCDTAKEIWDMLEAIGKVYPPQEVVRKVLRSLLKSWEAKKTTIEESKDLNTLKLEDLIGKLMTYEIEVQDSEDDASNDESSNEEDITKLISKEVKRFMKKNIKSKLAKRDEGESTKRSVKCYECNKIGHYRNECPKLKKGERKNKKSMKKKAFTATWSHDETSSTESESSLENGVANLCFMAQEDSYNDEEFSLSWLQEGAEARGNRLGVLVLVAKTRKKWIISRILAQRKGSKSIVLSGDLLWFDYLLKRKRLNLRRFIYWNLIKTYSSNMGLPHGALITRLVKRNNVDFTPFMLGKVQSGTTLNKASFENMQYEFRNGSWRTKRDLVMEQQSDEEEGDTDQEMAEQGAEEHEDYSPRPFRASMQRTNRETMELMISEMQQLHTDFYGF